MRHSPFIRKLLSKAPVLILLLLTSCLLSKEPLLGAGDTPFPDTFQLAELDSDGNIKIGQNGSTSITEFKRTGLSYTATKSGTVITVRDYDTTTKTYVVQASNSNNKSDKLFLYALLRRTGDRLTAYYATPEITSAMSGSKGSDLSFDTQEQLYAAMKVLFSNLNKADVERFRIASTSTEIASLENDISVAKNRASSNRSPTPGTSSPTTTADTDMTGQWKPSRFTDPMTDITTYAASLRSQSTDDSRPNVALTMMCNQSARQLNLVMDWSTPLDNLLPDGAIPITVILTRFDRDAAQRLGWHLIKAGIIESDNNGGEFLEGLTGMQGSFDPTMHDIKFVFMDDFLRSLGTSHSLLLRATDYQGNILNTAFDVTGAPAAITALVGKCNQRN